MREAFDLVSKILDCLFHILIENGLVFLISPKSLEEAVVSSNLVIKCTRLVVSIFVTLMYFRLSNS